MRERDLLLRIDAEENLRPLFFRKVIGIKWFDELSDRGYFDPEKNPPPTSVDENGYVKIPIWQVIEYLVKTAPELSSQDDAYYAKKFLGILVSTTEYARKNDFSNSRTWREFSKIIANIPPELMIIEDLSIVDYWLDDKYESGYVADEIGEKWLPSLLNAGGLYEQQFAARLLGYIYKVNFVDQPYAERTHHMAMLRVDYHYISRITLKVAKLSGKVLGASAISIFSEQLRRILNKLGNDSWSCIWHPAIEEHDQNKHLDNAENALINAYRDSLAGYISSKPDEAVAYITEMLKDGYKTIRRLAIHTIDENYRLCNEFSDTLIDSQYLEDNFRHEMWRYLNHHYGKLREDQQKAIRDLISDISKSDDDGTYHIGATAYRQATWLAAIKNFSQLENNLYIEKTKAAGVEPDHPSFSSYMSQGAIVVHESPVPLDVLQGMEVGQLIETLEPYQDENWQFLKPGIEGLSSALREIVKASPLKFYLHLSSFVAVDHAYVYQVIEAYRELWTEKRHLPWDDIWSYLLNFCAAVIHRNEFWNIEYAKERAANVANRYWIVSSIASLIEAGAKSDDYAFDQKYLEKAESIIKVLLRCESGGQFSMESDAVFVSINSPRGQSLAALINITLRKCRLSDHENSNDHADVWTHFQTYYDAELDRIDIPEYEFVTLVTNYLPNFLYMSHEWTLANLGRIFDRNNLLWWSCAMQGYSYVGTVYKELFLHLKEGGHLIQALNNEYLSERVKKRVVENIGVAYISDFEHLADHNSLIGTLISRRIYEELSNLVWLIWTMRKNDDGLKEKVYEIWPKILEAADTSTHEGKRLASQLCLWVVYVDEVDDQRRDLLQAIAPYADVDHHSLQLLKSLAAISKTQPFEAHEIWMKLLEISTPDFPEESIREILKNLEAQGSVGLQKAQEAVDEYIKFAIEGPNDWLSEIRNQSR